MEYTARRRPWRSGRAAVVATAMILVLAACGSSTTGGGSNGGLSGNGGNPTGGSNGGSSGNGSSPTEDSNGGSNSNGSTASNGGQGACQPPSLAHCFTEATMQNYLNKIIPMVEAFYTATWARPLLPAHIYFIPVGQSMQSGCQDTFGSSTQDDSSYDYCPEDNNIYLGQAELWQLYNGAGDVAPAIGLAHEMGHEQQTNAGVPAPQDNAETLIHEDQADCLSGAWFAYEINQGNIQPEDYPSTARYLEMIASAENDPNRDHGDLQERLNSFLDGKNGGPSGCNQFYPFNPIITSS